MKQSPVSYVTLDSKGNIHGVNGAFLALVGYERKRLLHLPISFVIDRQDFRRVWRHLTNASKQVQPGSPPNYGW